MPNEAYFHQNPNLLGLGKQFGRTHFGAFGVVHIFGQFISTHFDTVSSLSMFSINQQLFLQKNLLLYIQIPIWDWDLNFGCKGLYILPSCARNPCSGTKYESPMLPTMYPALHVVYTLLLSIVGL